MAKIELIYSTQATNYAKGRAYSNPRFFSTPRQDVSKVLLVGEWPNIRKAYEALNIPVERVDVEAVTELPAEAAAKAAPPADLVDAIKAEYPADPALTRREIEADLTAMDVDFDPAKNDAELMAERDAAREARDAKVDIPDDWSSLHWTQRVALAKRLRPEAPDIDAKSANDIIAAHVAASVA